MNGLLTLQECAKILKVHHMTIRRYIKSGKLKATRIGEKGMYRIKVEDLKRLMGERPSDLGGIYGQAQGGEDAE